MVGQRVALRQEARRREVMEAAVAIFSERGYRAASMADVAARLGMGKASLYHYVGSKEELLIELYEDVLRESVIAARRIAASEGAALDALAELIADRVAYTCHNRALLRIFFEEEAELPQRQQARLFSVRHEYEETLLEVVAAGEAAGEFALPTTPTIFVNTLLGAANWTYKWYQPAGPLTPEALGAQIAGILLAGLRS
ncbi:MAG TPA: TetR/AcrR family transcriptional regulator [Solirubrobacterales bacterium]|jgi:AcrR family transcriptional regulator|nr:TetR/AcrR family transcriptional regulator [Solirubrobacterales bacterium]